MRLVKGADILSARGEKLGTLGRVIIDPSTRAVTHLVIEKGFLFSTNKVVSMEAVNPDTNENIVLLTSEDDLDEYRDFEDVQYVDVDEAERPSDELEYAYWYPPLNAGWWRPAMHMPPPAMTVFTPKPRTGLDIPEGSIAMEEGADVYSSDDKHVGSIGQLIVDPQDNRVSHFVVGKGLLFKENKLIPVTWVADIEEDKVRLSVGSGTLDRLPEYQNDG